MWPTRGRDGTGTRPTLRGAAVAATLQRTPGRWQSRATTSTADRTIDVPKAARCWTTGAVLATPKQELPRSRCRSRSSWSRSCRKPRRAKTQKRVVRTLVADHYRAS
jgi:hypothetical protein